MRMSDSLLAMTPLLSLSFLVASMAVTTLSAVMCNCSASMAARSSLTAR